MQILSQDITFLVKRARVLRAEMTKAVSNNTNFISGPDRIRIDSYLKALKDFKDGLYHSRSWTYLRPALSNMI